MSHFLEEMICYRSREVRKEARKSMIAIFKKNFKTKANRNIIYTLNKLMIDGNRLKKYNLACLTSVAAKQLTDEGFKKVSSDNFLKFLKVKKMASEIDLELL